MVFKDRLKVSTPPQRESKYHDFQTSKSSAYDGTITCPSPSCHCYQGVTWQLFLPFPSPLPPHESIHSNAWSPRHLQLRPHLLQPERNSWFRNTKQQLVLPQFLLCARPVVNTRGQTLNAPQSRPYREVGLRKERLTNEV